MTGRLTDVCGVAQMQWSSTYEKHKEGRFISMPGWLTKSESMAFVT